MRSTGRRLRSGFENVIGQSGWFQCTQDPPSLSRLSGGSMSNYHILARLYGRLVGHDAVFRYTYAVQTGTDGTQTADYHRVFQAGDDPCRYVTSH